MTRKREKKSVSGFFSFFCGNACRDFPDKLEAEALFVNDRSFLSDKIERNVLLKTLAELRRFYAPVIADIDDEVGSGSA